jgi:acetyltransferase-like isoleucine patch superfamily enzyme
MSGFLLRIRRAETPAFSKLKNLVIRLFRTHIPIPKFLKKPLRVIYEIHWVASRILRKLYVVFYAELLLRGRCDHVGDRLLLWGLPDVSGHTSIRIGHDVSIYGRIKICSARTHDRPRLIIGNKVKIGPGVCFVVNQEITIEEGVQIGSYCSIRDSDSHPLDHRYRIAGSAPSKAEIRPVRICQSAWIGDDCTILKGVTIGEGAIIGTRSVVMTDVPAYARALGNPARVIINPGPPKGEFEPLQNRASPSAVTTTVHTSLGKKPLIHNPG